MTDHSSSNLAQKQTSLTASSGLHLFVKAPMSHKTYIRQTYLLFSCLISMSVSLDTFFSKFYFSIWEKLLVELQRIRRGKWKEFRNQRQKNAESQKNDSLDIKCIYYPLFSSPIHNSRLPPHVFVFITCVLAKCALFYVLGVSVCVKNVVIDIFFCLTFLTKIICP